MYRLSLCGIWELHEDENAQSVPVTVPGDVNAALQKIGKIPDPHYDTQARSCYWVTGKTWVYKKTFIYTERSGYADICLENVDGTAWIRLNGYYLPNNGGTMMWMFNDCWPTSDWSIIDYTKNPKPAYYAAKRACAPVCPIITARKGRLRFLVSNHTLETIRVNAVFGEAEINSAALWEKSAETAVDKFENGLLHALGVIPDAKCQNFYFLDLAVDGKQFDRVIYFPNGWKGLIFPNRIMTFPIVKSLMYTAVTASISISAHIRLPDCATYSTATIQTARPCRTTISTLPKGAGGPSRQSLANART